jgi:hypothetical protein
VIVDRFAIFGIDPVPGDLSMRTGLNGDVPDEASTKAGLS